ncbi:MAG: MBL fold metallo-hydrolase [Deinococcota bacterium]|jgi:glyoxylase-like metal-dependent hydrolase (beta-lactamase superfamily II)|nr:MBL fold metallo-hydrolase [Deinococcota bacterium]
MDESTTTNEETTNEETTNEERWANKERRPQVERLGDVFLLDSNHAGYPGTVGVYLLPGEGGSFALIECSTVPSLPRLEEAIREAGFEPEGLSDILVTHIHLDHAGAAGALASRYGARVYVHEIGAPHLADPSRLIVSATRIYEDEMERLWGKIEPVPAGQLHAVGGGESLRVAGRRIDVLYTPGHASHHVSYLLDDGSLLTGDAAAIRFAGSKVIRPATPPPETDLDIWGRSTKTMLAAAPQRLLLTHFGEVTDPAAHLERMREETHRWAEAVLEGMRRGEDEAALQARIAALSLEALTAEGASPELVFKHRVTSHDEMTVQGLTRYWRKHHPERLA